MTRHLQMVVLHRLQNQKRQQESALADIERVGGVIGKDGLARISSLENRIAQIESEIAKKEDEKEVEKEAEIDPEDGEKDDAS